MDKSVFEKNTIVIDGQIFYDTPTIAVGYGVTVVTVNNWIDKGWIESSRLKSARVDTVKRGRSKGGRGHLVPHTALFDEAGNWLFIPPLQRLYGGIGLFNMEEKEGE